MTALAFLLAALSAGADNARSFPGCEAVPMAWFEAMDARREELAGR